MTAYDREWSRIAENILMNGTMKPDEHARAKWADGTPAPTKYVLGEEMFFDTDEALVPEAKEFKEMSARRELFWIWVMKSNKLDVLRGLGNGKTSIWDEWEIKEGEYAGTIGTAYGYQMAKKCRRYPLDRIRWDAMNPKTAEMEKWVAEQRGDNFIMLDQTDHTIQTILADPGSQRIITSLWNIDELDTMALPPCVWKTNWKPDQDRLNLIVGVRSNDMGLGNAFNVYQYRLLQKMMAQATGYNMGSIQFDLDDAHLYNRHLDEAMQQLLYVPQSVKQPTLWLNPNVSNFYEFDLDKDIELRDYTAGPKRRFEVAI